MEQIILVDENDNEIGFGRKIEVHEEGKLHRAFSIFVFNSKGEMLIQKRAKEKYHSGGLWTNTVCSHPRKGEGLGNAVHRRLFEEMGFDCELKRVFSFIYKNEFENGLIENEFDHVFIGKYNGNFEVNREEVEAWKWISVEELKEDIVKNPKDYSCWFKILVSKLNFFIKHGVDNISFIDID